MLCISLSVCWLLVFESEAVPTSQGSTWSHPTPEHTCCWAPSPLAGTPPPVFLGVLTCSAAALMFPALAATAFDPGTAGIVMGVLGVVGVVLARPPPGRADPPVSGPGFGVP